MPRNRFKLAILAQIVIDPNAVRIHQNKNNGFTSKHSSLRLLFTFQVNRRFFKRPAKAIERIISIMQMFDSVLSSSKTATEQNVNQTHSHTHKKSVHCTASHVKHNPYNDFINIYRIKITRTTSWIMHKARSRRRWWWWKKRVNKQTSDWKKWCFDIDDLNEEKKIDEVRKHENNENYDWALWWGYRDD